MHALEDCFTSRKKKLPKALFHLKVYHYSYYFHPFKLRVQWKRERFRKTDKNHLNCICCINLRDILIHLFKLPL